MGRVMRSVRAAVELKASLDGARPGRLRGVEVSEADGGRVGGGTGARRGRDGAGGTAGRRRDTEAAPVGRSREAGGAPGRG